MLTLKRDYDKFPHCTAGEIILPDGKKIVTLERPWLDNKPYVSCIPEGEYIVRRDHTGRHRYHAIDDVAGRSDIEIHPANRVEQLLGCIAPALHFNVDGTTRNSTEACHLLIELYGENSFHLLITS